MSWRERLSDEAKRVMDGLDPDAEVAAWKAERVTYETDWEPVLSALDLAYDVVSPTAGKILSALDAIGRAVPERFCDMWEADHA